MRFLNDRAYLSGTTRLTPRLLQRETPITLPAAGREGVSVVSDADGAQRYFSDGEDWVADIPAGAEVILPPWESVPEGWFEIGIALPAPLDEYKLIGNRFSFNYTTEFVITWAIITPSNLYTDATRSTPVTTPPSPVGGVDDASGDGNHWAQDVSADRMIWDTYTRDGETISGLRSDAGNQHIDVPLGGAGAGSVLVFFRDSAVYAPADFDGSDVALESRSLPIEEMLFLDRTLTSTELAELVAAIRKERNRQPLDNFLAAGRTDFTFLFLNWRFITEIPVFNTSGATTFKGTFESTNRLSALPALDFSSATSIRGMCKSSGVSDLGSPDFGEVIDASEAFRGAKITSFNIDLPKATDCANMLNRCRQLVSVGAINLGSTTTISAMCFLCDEMTSFGIGPGGTTTTLPSLTGAWDATTEPRNGAREAFSDCASLADFPANVFDNSGTTNYFKTFRNCALTQQSVDNILVSVAQSLVNDPTLTDGRLDIDGGTNATPSATGQAAADDLRAAGWTVDLNGY